MSGKCHQAVKRKLIMETTRIVFIGVGGQGNILAARILGEACRLSGVPVVMSEIHGMAQRGGIVESDLVVGEATSPIISEGEADILVGFEPLETFRAIGKCNRNSSVITNIRALQPFTVSTGQGKYPEIQKALELVGASVRRLITLDGNTLAERAGNPLSLNMVMLGALVGSRIVFLDEKILRDAITGNTKKKFLESNLKAFDLGVGASAQ